MIPDRFLLFFSFLLLFPVGSVRNDDYTTMKDYAHSLVFSRFFGDTSFFFFLFFFFAILSNRLWERKIRNERVETEFERVTRAFYRCTYASAARVRSSLASIFPRRDSTKRNHDRLCQVKIIGDRIAAKRCVIGTFVEGGGAVGSVMGLVLSYSYFLFFFFFFFFM